MFYYIWFIIILLDIALTKDEIFLAVLLWKLKKVAVILSTALTLSSVVVPLAVVISPNNIEAATITKPVKYNQWKTIRKQKLSVADTKKLANNVL